MQFLGKVTTVLPASGRVELHMKPFSEAAKLSFDPQESAKTLNWLDRFVIQLQIPETP